MSELHSNNAGSNEYPLSSSDFLSLATRLKRETGIVLTDSKKPMVISRLSKRLRELGLSGFAEYRRLIETPGNGELDHMISALTTNITRFYREHLHYEDIEKNVLPRLIANLQRGGRVRLWSAGCSTGEEPYCLAFLVLSQLPDAARFDIKILATDLDPNVIAKATQGIYPASSTAALPSHLRDGNFIPLPGGDAMVRVDDRARNLISFKILNLLHDWPFAGPFDIVMCRNVVIYFDVETQRNLWPRFAQKMAEDGRLYIGHSERLTGTATRFFEMSGKTQFRRNEEAVKPIEAELPNRMFSSQG